MIGRSARSTLSSYLALKRASTRPRKCSQIRDLEDELGFRLLDRDRNRVALTDAGAVFLANPGRCWRAPRRP